MGLGDSGGGARLRGCPARDASLRVAIARAPLLALLTPSNFEPEVERVHQALVSGTTADLEFRYDRDASIEPRLLSMLEEAARAWRGEDELGALYADKAEEVALELRICEARERDGVASLAAARFRPRPEDGAEADRIADLWIDEGAAALGDLDVMSDDEEDPRSLVRRMREVVGAERLPFKVAVVRWLAPLAAVGDGMVQIAAGRRLSVEDVERTVVHEIEGHVRPSVRAAGSPLGLLRIGTARGSDHQEGFALFVEAAHGYLHDRRRLEIALRHVASRAAHRGEPFADVARRLADRSPATRAVARSVCRAFRGGGLGREAAYLPALVAVRRAIDEEPAMERWLASGRISVDAARALAELNFWTEP